MLIKKTNHELSLDTITALHYYYDSQEKNICFFDIETTGLSPEISAVYLIGALFYQSQSQTFELVQWFADDYVSEAELLRAFSSFLDEFDLLVHYNGARFDIPYLEKKYQAYDIASPFSTIENLDLYKQIYSMKSFFDVPNLKLNTVEKLVGFLRHDRFSGKECIDLYSKYMQKKFFRDETKNKEYHLLLQHNMDDLLGTYLAGTILSYKCRTKCVEQNVCENKLELIYSSIISFPFPLKKETPTAILQYEDKHIYVTIPLFCGTLYHFYSDYKNYYYLPFEDTAIHKSVGAFVEKEYREAAKASNCYTKKEGVFLPLPKEISHATNFLLFQENYRSKQNYILLKEAPKTMEFYDALITYYWEE